MKKTMKKQIKHLSSTTTYGEATVQDDNPYLFNPTKNKTKLLTPRSLNKDKQLNPKRTT